MTLKECKTREEVENVFVQKNISKDNFEAKNALLLDAMGDPEMFYSNGSPTNEQKYEMILISFLDGEWKYAEAVSKINVENM